MRLSAVVPVFNEEKNLPILYKRLNLTLKRLSSSFEIIFVDDGSSDKSLKFLKQFHRQNRKVKILSFSRNFGHMSAILAGLSHSSGKYVALLDADLQDPPELIEEMYKKAIKGYRVVYGIKTARKESLVRRVLFTSFYRILNAISSYKMPLDVGTFSLIDKSVVDILVNLKERNMYFSGLRSWTGFPQTGIIYKRGKRLSGKEASIGRLINLALNGFFSFSYVPLRLASFMGFVTAITAFIFIIIVGILRLFFSFGLVGWASTLSAILLIGGVQLITLGILGEYLGRIYDEVKGRPQYIISEKIGLKK